MAHFAKISENNIVLQVLIVNDKDILDKNNQESESIGQQYLQQHNNWPSHLWIQTSYNTRYNIHLLGKTPFRGNYAGIGYTWDTNNQIFLPPKPYISWILNLEKAMWKSPIGDAPDIDRGSTYYEWNENNKTWNFKTRQIS